MAAETPHDPDTWIWTQADKLALELVQNVHNRGIKIIFDGVFNHTGITHWAFCDVVKNQKGSRYRDWFAIKSWRDVKAGSSFQFQGWFNYNELPEFKQDKNGIVTGPKKYLFDITKRWMDPGGNGDIQLGIDGWRLDVAFCIKHPFWRQWRLLVKKINPDAYITAEVVRPIDELNSYLQGDEFDAVMNYNFTFAVSEYIHGGIDKKTFDRYLSDLRNAFHPDITYVQQNLLGSHDTERIASHIKNGHICRYRDWHKYQQLTKGSNSNYDTGKPKPDDISLQKLLVLLQMTYVGAPMIYYGDECGLWGANDPDCRKPMLWRDMDFEDSVCLPGGGTRSQPETVAVNTDLLDYYKRLTTIRNLSKALQLGNFKFYPVHPSDDIYSFTRAYDKELVLVILNKSKKWTTVTLPHPDRTYYDLFFNIHLTHKNGTRIAPRSGRILKMQPKP